MYGEALEKVVSQCHHILEEHGPRHRRYFAYLTLLREVNLVLCLMFLEPAFSSSCTLPLRLRACPVK